MFKGYELGDILSFEEFTEYLGISRSLGYKLLTSGEIRGVKIGKIWKIPRNSIEDYVNENLGKSGNKK